MKRCDAMMRVRQGLKDSICRRHGCQFAAVCRSPVANLAEGDRGDGQGDLAWSRGYLHRLA